MVDLGDLSEKIKETSNITRTLASKILERVQEFKKNFSAWPDSVSNWAKATTEGGKRKVYHRQPKRATVAKKKTSKKPKNKLPRKSAKGRTKPPK